MPPNERPPASDGAPFDAATVQLDSTLFFGVKAAIFPLFFWLPGSYHTASMTVAAIFAGLLTKVGVYATFRIFSLFFEGGEAMRDVMAIMAAGTMLFGGFGAAVQWDVRRILSFHIISQIGYMLLGLALGTPAALGGAAFYQIYRTADGRHVVLGGREAKFAANLLDALGRPDLIPLAGRPAGEQDELIAFLRDIFAGRTRDEWVAWFADKDVAFSPVLDFREALDQSFVRDRGLTFQSGGGHQLAPAIRMSDSRPWLDPTDGGV